MSRRDFLDLVRKAEGNRGDLKQTEPLDGIGLHHNRVMVTAVGAIAFMRWQARRFDGTWDPGPSKTAPSISGASISFSRPDDGETATPRSPPETASRRR